MYYISLYYTAFKYNLKSLYEYRFDFWVGIITLMIMQGIGLMFLWVIYQYTTALSGWSLNEVVFIYGFQQVVHSLYITFFGNVTGLEQLIKHGTFDCYLVRPAFPLFQLMITKLNITGFAGLIVSIILLVYSVYRIGLQLNLAKFVALMVFLTTGVLIYFSLSLIVSTCAFWLTRTMRLQQLIFDFSEFTRYPIDIFHSGLQLVLTVVIPFALASYYPALFFVKEAAFLEISLKILGGTLLFYVISYRFWRFGLKYYHSTGT